MVRKHNIEKSKNMSKKPSLGRVKGAVIKYGVEGRGRRGFRGYEIFQTSQGGYGRKIHVLRGYENFLGYGGSREIFGCFLKIPSEPLFVSASYLGVTKFLDFSRGVMRKKYMY